MAHEVGLPMCAEMILALKANRKTETRRVIIPQPTRQITDWSWDAEVGERVIWHGRLCRLEVSSGRNKAASGELCPCEIKPPYQVGQRLWFREALVRQPDAKVGAYALYAADRSWVWHPSQSFQQQSPVYWRWKVKKLASIYMPKDCTRYWRDCTSVRLERVQEITGAGCLREGYPASAIPQHPETWFVELWDRLNAERGYGWDLNPWAWVVGWENGEGATD